VTAILACSPRRGGNCDAAAAIISATGFGCSGAGSFPVTALRDFPVLPCLSCGHCAEHPLHCPLQDKDESAPLFALLQQATRLVLIAPVYWYHVPAQLKALMDRSQPWWAQRGTGAGAASPPRRAHAVLVAGRPPGRRLFEGSLLSLRYWLRLFGYEFAEPLTLQGLDGPLALSRDERSRERIARYARERVFSA
jgi:hypothetical protein